MNGVARLFLMLGSVSGAMAVVLGAFGAHGLKNRLSEKMLANWMTGVEYQFYHTFALLAVGLLAMKFHSTALNASGWSFLTGTLIFSGSLYVMALTGMTKLGAITPIGGLLLIAGWVLLAVSVCKG